MTTSFTFGELPPPPPPEILEELRGYEVAWLSDAMELNLMDSAIHAVHPNLGGRIAGPAVTVTVPPGDFLMIPEAMRHARPGDVLVIDAGGETKRSVWGEYFSTWAQGLGLAGLIIDGATRDVTDIEALGFPVFARATTPRKPTMTGPGEVNVPISCGGICVIPGDIVIADAEGVITVPLRHLDKVLDSVRITAARERSHNGVSPGGREDFLAFFDKSFGPRIKELGGTTGREK
jgi:4-hydroxy-4-methyl-2-oxoglutarate aldolase